MSSSLPGGTTFPRGLGEDIRWPLVPARDLFELQYGRALVQSSRRPGAVPVYGTNGRCGSHDEALFAGPGVILGRKGQGPLGVEWCDGPFWVIDTAYSLVPRRPNVDLKFSYYLFKHVGLNHLKDGTSNPSLSRDTFGAQAVPLPPLREQKRIARILSALDDRIQLNHHTNHALESIARAIFKSWFVDFDPVRKKMEGGDPGLPPDLAALFPNSLEESVMGRVPSGWPVVPLSSLVDVNPKYQLTYGSLVPYVEMSGLPTDGARVTQRRLREFTSGSRFRNGDVLVARITPCLENGKTALVDFLDRDVTAWGSTEFLVLRPHESIPTEYVYCLSRTDAFRDYAVGNMNGSSGRQRVPVEALERLPIVQPPDGLLGAFGQVARSAVALMAENDRQSESLAALRACLLPKLLLGEISL